MALFMRWWTTRRLQWNYSSLSRIHSWHLWYIRLIYMASNTNTWASIAIPFHGAVETTPLETFHWILTWHLYGYVMAPSNYINKRNVCYVWYKKCKILMHVWTNTVPFLPWDAKSINMQIDTTTMLIWQAMENTWICTSLVTYLYWKVWTILLTQRSY